MKKLQLIFFTILTVFTAMLMMSVSRVPDVPSRQEAKSSANLQEYAKLLNGDDAFFQDYNDFLKGGRKWKYITENAILSFGKINIFNIVFKTDQGNRQKLNFDEFWGWRQDGKVYRNGDFVSGRVTKIPFGIEQVTTGYILYHPHPPDNASIQPFEWLSDNLTSPIMPSDVYFKSHSKETYDRIEAFKKTCYHIITARGKKIQQWTSDSDRCLRTAPDIVLLYSNDNLVRNLNQGSYKK